MEHVPGALRPPIRNTPGEVMYAIGIEYAPGNFGMTHGPAPTQEELLEVVPDDGAVLLRLNSDAQNEVLWRWAGDRWLTPEAPQTMVETRPVATRVVLNVSGGVLEEAFADGAFQLVVLDDDVEGVDEDDVVAIDGLEVYPTVFAGERDHDAGARVNAIFAQLREHGGVIESESTGDEADGVRAQSLNGKPVNNRGHLAFKWLSDFAATPGAPSEAGDALEAWHAEAERAKALQVEILESHTAGYRLGLMQVDRPTQPAADRPALVLLKSCPTVNNLLQAVQRSLSRVADPAVRRDLLQQLEPFSRGVAAAFYTRSEMAQQAPMNIEVTDAEADAALERLVRNFQHPWDEFSGQFGDEVHQRVLDALKAQRRREGA